MKYLSYIVGICGFSWAFLFFTSRISFFYPVLCALMNIGGCSGALLRFPREPGALYYRQKMVRTIIFGLCSIGLIYSVATIVGWI
jgi:hypothetical protein